MITTSVEAKKDNSKQQFGNVASKAVAKVIVKKRSKVGWAGTRETASTAKSDPCSD